MRWLLPLLALLVMPAAAAVPDTPPDAHAAAEASFAEALAAECAHVTCRKAVRPVILRMVDGSEFRIDTRPLPYLDDKGTLILFADESVTLSYPEDDEKLEHPVVSAIKDPLGTIDLPAAASTRSLTFSFRQMTDKPDMVLGITNTTKAMVKYDAVAFFPDVVNHNARGSHTATCALPPPEDNAPRTLGLEHWPQPLVMLIITNIRALEPGALRACD